MSKKIDYCSREECKVQPINKSKQSGAIRYSEYIRSGHYSKKILQGQPYDIKIYDILAHDASIQFSVTGNPIYYDIFIKIGREIVQTYRVTSTIFPIENLIADTHYEVEIKANYVSGDIFTSSNLGKFKTLEEGPIRTIQYIYPTNALFELKRTNEFDDITNEYPIQIRFEKSPGEPQNYYIQLLETNTELRLSTEFLVLEPYTIYIRNDVPNTLKITSEYFGRFEYKDMSYTFIDTIPSFHEGYSDFTFTVYANSIDISYSEMTGDPTYIIRIENNNTKSVENTEIIQTYTNAHSIDDLQMNTEYTLSIETSYISSSKNRYISSVPFTTLNEGPVRDVRVTSFRNSLVFDFQPPSDDFTTLPNAFYIVTLRMASSNEIIQYQYYSSNTTSITFENLNENTEYNFYIASAYQKDTNDFTFTNTGQNIIGLNTPDGLVQQLNKELYEFSQVYKTLYEGPVESIIEDTITGTSVEFTFETFTIAPSPPSIPVYYIVNYTTNNITNTFETYLQNPLLYNLLIPNTTYEITVTAVYSTGNRYIYEKDPISITTLDEGPVETFEALDIKGDKITLNWTYYDAIQPPSSDIVQLKIYQDNVLEQTVDISYTQTSYDVLDRMFNTTYRFTLEVTYDETVDFKYEKTIFVSTLNQYAIIIKSIATAGSSIIVEKEPENNQDDYVLRRISQENTEDLLRWVNRRFLKNGIEDITVQSNTYLYVEMDRAGYYVFYSPTQTQIDIYNVGLLTDNTYEYNKTLTTRRRTNVQSSFIRYVVLSKQNINHFKFSRIETYNEFNNVAYNGEITVSSAFGVGRCDLEYQFDSQYYNATTKTILNQSTRYIDILQNNGNAILFNDPLLDQESPPTTDVSSNSIQLDKTKSQYVLVDGFQTHDDTETGLTFAIWFKASSQNSRIFDFGNGPEMDSIVVYIDSSGINFAISTVTGYIDNLTPISNVIDDTWHHLIWIMKDNTSSIYIDGSLHSSFPMGPPTSAYRSNNYLGKSNGDDPYYDGFFAEFRYYPRALNANEIQRVYGGASLKPSTPLMTSIFETNHNIEIDFGAEFNIDYLNLYNMPDTSGGYIPDVIWQTDETGGSYAKVSPSGTLQLYNASNNVIWSSHTSTYSGASFLTVQNDGNLVIYEGTSPNNSIQYLSSIDPENTIEYNMLSPITNDVFNNQNATYSFMVSQSDTTTPTILKKGQWISNSDGTYVLRINNEGRLVYYKIISDTNLQSSYQYNTKIELLDNNRSKVGELTYSQQFEFNDIERKVLHNYFDFRFMNVYHLSLSDIASTFALGYNNDIVDIFTNYFEDSASTEPYKTIHLPSNIRSHCVSLSRNGKICAVSDERANENADNGIFIYNIETDQSTFVKYENSTIYYWYRHRLNKYVEFNSNGTRLAIAFELETTNLNDSISYESYVSIYDISSNTSTSFEYTKRSDDLSGNQVALNGDGNSLLVADDRHIDNGLMIGRVFLYDITIATSSVLTHTFLGSTGSLINDLPIKRKIYINDDATVVSMSEYTYSYTSYNTSPVRNGQVKIYEYKNEIWQQRGNSLRQGDLTPTNPDDPIQIGEWYGYYTIMDRSGGRILIGTKPKISSITNTLLLGTFYLYVWEDPDTIIQINEWPVEIPNLQSDIDYQFRIESYYDANPDYPYYTVFSGSIPSGRTPITNVMIYDNKIDISWIPVDPVSGYSMTYKLQYITNDTTTNITLPYTTVDGSNNFYSITGFNANQEVYVRFSSEYTINNGNEIPNEYVGFVSTVYTLNETPLDTANIVELNNSNLIVVRIVQTGNQNDISFNEIVLENTADTDKNYSVILEPTIEYLDLDFVSAGEEYNFTINTTYVTPEPQGNISYVSNNPYAANRILDISTAVIEPYEYVRNGTFYADYAFLFSESSRSRNQISITKSLWLTTSQDISEWEASRFVYIAENVSGTESTEKLLNVPDVSYHALLYRSEDLAPGTNVPFSFLEQSLDKLAYSQRYKLTYFTANHDAAGVEYNELDATDNAVFSEKISYKVKLVSDNETIYETSTLYSTDISWAQSEIIFFLDRTYDNVTFRLERLQPEYNNLFISNIRLTGQSLLEEDLSYQWESSWNSSNWNTLTDISQGQWSDLLYSTSSYEVFRYIFSISVSFWVFIHFDGANTETCFYIGETGNEKLKFQFDNENIYITNKLETSNTVRIPITFNFNTVHHLAYTYNTQKVKLYLDGRLHHSYTIDGPLMNANGNDPIHLGNNNTKNMITKFTRIYDYELARYEIENMYTEQLLIYHYGDLGNPIEYSNNIIESYTNGSQNETVFVYLHDIDYGLGKGVKFYPTFSENIDLSGSTSYSISFWLGEEINAGIDISGNNQTIQITNSNIIQKHNTNHVVLTTRPSSIEFYLNGFFYQTFSTDLGSSSIDISGTNIGDVYVYDISFNERDVLTSYYNYYQLSNEYIVYGGIYRVTLTAPTGGNQQAVNYFLTPLEPNSEYFFSSDVSGSFGISNSTQYNYDIPLTDFSLNWVNSLQKEFAQFKIPIYGLEVTFSSVNNPYIDFSFGDAYLYETLDIQIFLENNVTNTSYSYLIAGDVDSSDFTDTLMNAISLNGNITNQVTLKIPDDRIIENDNHYETLIFRIPHLNIAKSMRIYERVFMTVNKQIIANFGESSASFSVQLFSLVDASFNYEITGVAATDISATTLSDTFTLTKQEIYYESNILNFEVLVDPFQDQSKFNLPFHIFLTNTDLSYIEHNITINDYFNIQSDTASVFEGGSFTITLKTPFDVANNTSFNYTITGISSEDLINENLSGTITVQSQRATKTFTVAKDIAKDYDEVFTITVHIPGDGQSDVATSVTFINIEPVFNIRAIKNVGDSDVIDNIDEGETFYVDLSTNNIPDNTLVPFLIFGEVSALDVSGDNLTVYDNYIRGTFTVIDSSANFQIHVLEDLMSEGGEMIQIAIEGYVQYSVFVYVNDTSVYTIYNLTSNVTNVDEGSSFTIFLETVNVAENTLVDYTIKGIESADILSLNTLDGQFTIDASGNASQTFNVRADSLTESSETARFELIGTIPDPNTQGNTQFDLANIFVNIVINDTSRGPSITINMKKEGVKTDTFFNNDTIRLELITQDVEKGSRISFTLESDNGSDLPDGILTTLQFYDGSYYGTFVVGYVEFYVLEVENITSNIGTSFSLEGGNLFNFNDNIGADTVNVILQPEPVINEGSE